MPNNKSRGNRKSKGKPNDIKNKCDYMQGDIKSAQDASQDKDSKPVFNDLRWYVNSEQILNDAARLPYNIPVGLPYVRDGKVTVNDGNFNSHSYDDAIPGIFVSDVMPVLGGTEEGSSSAVNVAANSIFQKMRSKISGTRFYLAVDTMLYMGSMDSLYCYITSLTRLYATCFTYHQSNRYLARALVESQGVDFDDLSQNLTQFRAGVNLRIAKVRALYLPSILPIFLRHSWMFSHYFLEGDSEKDQIYYHRLGGYHTFQYDSNGYGMLKAHPLPNTANGKMTVSDLLKVLDDMIDPIYQDEDFNRISGDMLKTYEGKVFSLSEIPDIVTTQFSYSEEVLLQFKNAKYKAVLRKTSNPDEWMGDFFDYYQTTRGELHFAGNDNTSKPALYNFKYVTNVGTDSAFVGIPDTQTTDSLKIAIESMLQEWSKDTLLTSPHHDVVAGENMINTRMTLAMQLSDNASDPYGISYPLLYFGSEWPISYALYTYHKNKVNGNMYLFGTGYDRTLILDSDDAGRIKMFCASIIPIRSAFKFLPELTVIERRMVNSVINAWEAGRSIFEVDNYTLVSPISINGLHQAAIMGEYNIPEIATST